MGTRDAEWGNAGKTHAIKYVAATEPLTEMSRTANDDTEAIFCTGV
jgi:hypothetical protein